MQMLLGLAGLGISVPKTSLGVGAAIGKLYFRENPYTAKEKALSVKLGPKPTVWRQSDIEGLLKNGLQ